METGLKVRWLKVRWLKGERLKAGALRPHRRSPRPWIRPGWIGCQRI